MNNQNSRKIRNISRKSEQIHDLKTITDRLENKQTLDFLKIAKLKSGIAIPDFNFAFLKKSKSV